MTSLRKIRVVGQLLYYYLFFASTTSAKMSVIEQLAFFLYYIMCPGINTYYVYKGGTNGRMSLKP